MSRVSEQEKTRNSLSDNLHEMTEHPMTVNRRGYQKDRNSVGFGAYDCDVFQVFNNILHQNVILNSFIKSTIKLCK